MKGKHWLHILFSLDTLRPPTNAVITYDSSLHRLYNLSCIPYFNEEDIKNSYFMLSALSRVTYSDHFGVWPSIHLSVCLWLSIQ